MPGNTLLAQAPLTQLGKLEHDCAFDNINITFPRFDNCTTVGKRIALILGTTKGRRRGSQSTLKWFGKNMCVDHI